MVNKFLFVYYTHTTKKPHAHTCTNTDTRTNTDACTNIDARTNIDANPIVTNLFVPENYIG